MFKIFRLVLSNQDRQVFYTLTEHVPLMEVNGGQWPGGASLCGQVALRAGTRLRYANRPKLC